MHHLRLLLDLLARAYWANSENAPGPRGAGPGQATRWVKDSRDEATGERLDNLEDPFRLTDCHTIITAAQKPARRALNPSERSPNSR